MCAPAELLVGQREVEQQLAGYAPVALERLDVEEPDSPARRHKIETRAHEELRRELARTRTEDRALTPLADRVGEWIVEGWRVVLCCHVLSSAERLRTAARAIRAGSAARERHAAGVALVGARAAWKCASRRSAKASPARLRSSRSSPRTRSSGRERSAGNDRAGRTARRSKASPSSPPATTWSTRTTASEPIAG